MKKNLISLTLLLTATVGNATPINTVFSFTAGVNTIASGNFVYDSSLDGGNVSYADLSQFKLSFFGNSTSVYDLAFINSGNDSPFKYFSFDTINNSFNSQLQLGLDVILADVKNGNTGFLVTTLVPDHVIVDQGKSGQQYYDNLTITSDLRQNVPEPTSIALLAIGLLSFAASRRNTGNWGHPLACRCQ